MQNYLMGKGETMNDREYLVDLIFEMFRQGCLIGGKYNHLCISTYQEAQAFLLKEGKIEKEDCRYGKDD